MAPSEATIPPNLTAPIYRLAGIASVDPMRTVATVRFREVQLACSPLIRRPGAVAGLGPHDGDRL